MKRPRNSRRIALQLAIDIIVTAGLDGSQVRGACNRYGLYRRTGCGGEYGQVRHGTLRLNAGPIAQQMP
jgi:hypothetical protein